MHSNTAQTAVNLCVAAHCERRQHTVILHSSQPAGNQDMCLPTLYTTLADLTLIAHVALVIFVVFGQFAILIGWASDWVWTRGAIFRLTHLVSIVVVMLETWFGVTCPLTALENHWRQLAGQAGYQTSFIGDWLDRLLFYNAPDWLFTTLYTLFALAVLATFILYPPRFRHG